MANFVLPEQNNRALLRSVEIGSIVQIDYEVNFEEIPYGSLLLPIDRNKEELYLVTDAYTEESPSELSELVGNLRVVVRLNTGKLLAVPSESEVVIQPITTFKAVL